MAKRDAKLARWEIWTVRVLKAVVLTVLAGAAIYLFRLCVRAGFTDEYGPDLAPRIFFGLFYFFMGACFLLFAFEIWREPKTAFGAGQYEVQNATPKWMLELRAIRSPKLADFEESGLAQRMRTADYQGVIDECERLLQNAPTDLLVLLYRACALLNLRDARADGAFRDLAAQVPKDRAIVHAGILEMQIEASLHGGDFEVFLAACKRFLEQEISLEAKIRLLDRIACTVLYMDMRDRWEFAELCARKAVALAPKLLTVKGTLGGVLVERVEFAEAEPLLRKCFEESPTPHDREICAYYLAVVEERRGSKEETVELVRLAGKAYPAPWLMKKVEVLRERLEATKGNGREGTQE